MKSDDAFDKVMKSVKRVREPGSKPEEDLKDMDRYVCDLCQGVFGRKEIKQCGFCGRWVCDDCWNDELKACQSCSGLILLAKVGKEKEEEDEQS
ncbi:MAG: hypothetical protein R6U61_04240 [Thermoplasmata archaeon]